MKKLILKLEIENTEENKDNHEFVYALREAIKQIENGNREGDLRNEDIETGYWEITEE